VNISPNSSGGLWEAIESANNGDIIYLKDGEYTGEYNVEININKNITIKGEGKNVKINGENKYSYLFQMANQDSTKKKLTPVTVNLVNLKVTNFNGDVIDNWGSLRVTNCTFSNNKISGAIVSNYNSSYCKIVNSIFTKNTFIYNKSEDTAGIAIYIDNVASFSITGSTFSNFKSTNNSQGVAIQNIESTNVLVNKCKFNNLGEGCTMLNIDKGSVRVINSVFTNDKHTIWNVEGFISVSKSIFKNSMYGAILNLDKMKISDSRFTNNKGIKYDGIIENTKSMTITRSNFTNNKGTVGTINNFGVMTISKSTFKNNKGETAGAITNKGPMKISNSIFTKNTAKKYGGVIRNGDEFDKGTLKIINTKFINNIAGKKYKAVFNAKESKLTKTKVKITPKEGTKVKK
jgi:hypothetical protein